MIVNLANAYHVHTDASERITKSSAKVYDVAAVMRSCTLLLLSKICLFSHTFSSFFFFESTTSTHSIFTCEVLLFLVSFCVYLLDHACMACLYVIYCLIHHVYVKRISFTSLAMYMLLEPCVH
jgi:hypothetical protein